MPREVRNQRLTWGAAIGGLGAISASAGRAPGQRLRREDSAHSPGCNQDPHPARAASARAPSHFGPEGGEEGGSRQGQPPLLPQTGAWRLLGQPPPATPSHTRRMVGEAQLTPLKPVRSVAPTRALRISASRGLRTCDLRPTQGLRSALDHRRRLCSLQVFSAEGLATQSGLRRNWAGQWPQRRGRARSAPAHPEPRSRTPRAVAST